jgi:uncharacterized damage-inducible protein DinB
MPNKTLQELFRLNLWSNQLIIEACRDLTNEQLGTDLAGTYGDIGRTLAHIAAAEAGYAWRFDQNSDRFQWDEDDPVPSVATLGEVLNKTGARFIELAVTTPDDQILTYQVDGEQRQWPAWVVLGQVIDHGREHRSQIATILTQLGFEPPEIDMWGYAISVGAGPAD